MKSSEHGRFHIRSLTQLREEIERRELSIPVEDDIAILGQRVAFGGRELPNRFSVQPMEGFDADDDGRPGELSFRRYRRYADGGFGLIWFEATAVIKEARSNPHQFWIHDDNVDTFKDLVTATREAAQRRFDRDVVLVIQLTHSGRYSKPFGRPAPLIAHHSPILDPRHGLPRDYPLVSDAYLDGLQNTYVAAAKLAAAAGFDGIDIKSCHRYLVSELLASFTRDGRYGGSFENRTRLLLESLTKIQAAGGPFITTRMNAYDAIEHPYGFGVDQADATVPDLAEPIELARRLQAIGVPILNISTGNPYFNPHVGRPYDFPVQGAPVPHEHPLVGMDRFMAVTRAMQASVPDLPIIGSGYTWLRQFAPYVAAGVIKTGGAALLGIGRGAFAYPDMVRDILERGSLDPSKCCVTCSACSQIMRDGGRTGCVVRDSEVYGPEYRRARRFALDRLKQEAERCRACETPTCSEGCPACVNVPDFVKAFADNDIATAYAVLRRTNALPEMCAYVCPADVQCEGHCVEKIFTDNPIPIRDIQLVVCREARRLGLTGVPIPENATGAHVAVVGGGPTGIAAAVRLIERGHQVTLFERATTLGGTPDRIIPSERYTNAASEISAVLEPAVRTGRLEIRCGEALGTTLTLDALCADHDAVLLAMGLTGSISLGHAEGVLDAMTFLREAKSGALTTVPPAVAVLGGGNTAMDAAVTAAGLGATDVYLVYRRSFVEMPAWPAERNRFIACGGHCMILTQPLGYETNEAGALTGIRIARTELGAPDGSGRRRPRVVAGSENVLKVGMAIEAIGQTLPDSLRAALDTLAPGDDNRLATRTPGSFATVRQGVYAAGDLINGGTTAVRGIAEGMHAAAEIDEALS